MRDIVDRLRAGHQYSGMTDPLETEAADEIERLRSALYGISIASAKHRYDAERMQDHAKRALGSSKENANTVQSAPIGFHGEVK